MTDDLFTFEDPSEAALMKASSPKGPYVDIAIGLMEHPGKWARLKREFGSRESAKSARQNLLNGRVAGFDKGQWEVLVDELEGKPVLYARYMPRKKDEGGALAGDPEDDTDVSEVTPNDLGRKARAWGREQGRDIPDRGRLPRQLVMDYLAATGQEVPSHLSVVQ